MESIEDSSVHEDSHLKQASNAEESEISSKMSKIKVERIWVNFHLNRSA